MDTFTSWYACAKSGGIAAAKAMPRDYLAEVVKRIRVALVTAIAKPRARAHAFPMRATLRPSAPDGKLVPGSAPIRRLLPCSTPGGSDKDSSTHSHLQRLALIHSAQALAAGPLTQLAKKHWHGKFSLRFGAHLAG